MDYHNDADQFSELLRKTKLPKNILSLGNFKLQGKLGVSDKIEYNESGMDFLWNKHEYTFPLLTGDLQVSLQLYENVSHHYRLFCYTKFKNTTGMCFSLNLTTEKESENIIYLAQKIKFSERYKGDKELAKAHRRRKQLVFVDLLHRLGVEVSDNQDIVLGVFDPQKKQFLNTEPSRFLNDFIVVSLLKGHFQGNKGYQLEILPNYNQLDYVFNPMKEASANMPKKISEKKGKRNIPLGMRYKVLKRDNSKCVACGRSPEDNIKLHIDHKIPYSLGGMTELSNLQTLCNECNLSKSNKFIDN